jgi:hypothetical protein
VARRKGRKTSRKPRGSGPPITVPPAVRRGAILLAIVVLLLVLVGLGLKRIRQYVSSRPEHRVDLAAVRVVERPPWLTDEDVAALTRSAALTGTAGFFDADLPDRVRDAWNRSPVVAGAPRVARLHPNRLVVDVPVRRPVVAVRDFGDASLPLVLLDRAAVVWPERFAQPVPERFGPLLVIECYDQDALSVTPAPGYAWRDRRILEGLAVAIDLRLGLDEALAERLRLRTIDVTNVGVERAGVSEIVLATEDGIHVEWGRSSASPRAGRELAVEEKIENLRQAFRDPAAVDGHVVKVQFERPVLAPE